MYKTPQDWSQRISKHTPLICVNNLLSEAEQATACFDNCSSLSLFRIWIATNVLKLEASASRCVYGTCRCNVWPAAISYFHCSSWRYFLILLAQVFWIGDHQLVPLSIAHFDATFYFDWQLFCCSMSQQFWVAFRLMIDSHSKYFVVGAIG